MYTTQRNIAFIYPGHPPTFYDTVVILQYDEQNGEAEIPSSRYDAVCHFADRLCRMEMDAAM